jgi:hypothetical protein
MRAEDKGKFLETIKMGYGNYNKKLPEDTLLRMWWKQLQYYDINLVKKSFDKWITENRFIFTVADIVQLCRQGNEQQRHMIANQTKKLDHKQIKNKEKFSQMLRETINKMKMQNAERR